MAYKGLCYIDEDYSEPIFGKERSAIKTDTAVKALYEAAQWCDHLLIGAGAGLSAAAGLSFADEALFKARYPRLYERGVHSDYQTFSYQDWSLGEFWGYFADHLHRVLRETPPLPLYRTLLEVVKKKDFYILTSNVDRQFLRNGFPGERLFEYQGSFSKLFCSKACGENVWPAEPFWKNALAHLNKEKMIVAEAGIPRCPNCGAPLEYAGRNLPTYHTEKARYDNWLERSAQDRTCIVEFGVGFNSAGIIRVPFERIVGERPKDKVRFFRVTTDYPDDSIEIAYPEIPVPIEDKSLSLYRDAAEVITEWHSMSSRRETGAPCSS